MKVSVKDALHNVGKQYPIECKIDYQAMDFGGELKFNKPVEFCGSFTCKGTYIELEGTVKASLTLTCNRCNEEYTFNMELPLLETFKAQVDELDDAYSIGVDNMIDLEQPVLGVILLNIPIQRLCSTSCKGLCPQCGVNRNEIPCSCSEEPEKDNPFAVLLQAMNDEEV